MSLIDHLMNKVIVHLYMLTATMENMIGSKIGCKTIVRKEINWNLYQNTQVKEELLLKVARDEIGS